MSTLGRRKIMIIMSAVTVCAVLGAVAAIVVWRVNAKTTSESSGNKLNADAQDGVIKQTNTSSNVPGSNEGYSTSNITSDPAKETYTLSAYAIGDWGTTVTPDSCCKKGNPTPMDRNAENAVGTLMGIAVEQAEIKPQVVIGHGDNFYWMGIMGKEDQQSRFEETFEKKFSVPSLKTIPWVNVMGNHDYGGSSYICTANKDQIPCKSADEVVQGLNEKFTLQSTYKSPNDDRWIMKDHFYVHHIEDTKSGVSIDIFNMDTNDADEHGARATCCQCYGYSKGSKTCESISRGHLWCAGGNNDIYDACVKQLNDWGQDSRQKLKEAVAKSTATWKIVNTHYSVYNHYSQEKQEMWWDLLKGLGINVWINGHTHGEKHDYSSHGIHFIENGSGGGIINESGSGIPPYALDTVKQLWAYKKHDYGFFDFSASKEWLRVRFLTFDNDWDVQNDFVSSKIGGVATKHCWYIPLDGGEGETCKSAPPLHHHHHKDMTTNSDNVNIRVRVHPHPHVLHKL